MFLWTSWLLGYCSVIFGRLREDKNDVEAQKIYDDYFPLYKPNVWWVFVLDAQWSNHV